MKADQTHEEINMTHNEAVENEAMENEAVENEVIGDVDTIEEDAVEGVADVATLEEELRAARAEAEEYLDGWRRAQAEFANYKKRQRAEQQRTQELANAALISRLLPVLDDLDRALATMPAPLHQLSWSEGVLMVKRKLELILEAEGVEPIETQGEMFDPHCHEAVTHEELDGYEEGEIIGEIQRGYVLDDRVLRPALVRVAKAPISSLNEREESGGVESTVDDE